MTPPAPQSLTILTGASRGMGAAMARQLLAPGH
ncbi:MAG: short-chain dehydrogenase, partial [Proteobacteria bacterium]|nr:short-chain dehydrogenase [Pseudomonadota bacterium]